jgi:CheY-like chemotaxis protein
VRALEGEDPQGAAGVLRVQTAEKSHPWNQPSSGAAAIGFSRRGRRPRYSNAVTAPPYTILLVDDDEDVREAIAAFLEARHYRVLMARTGDDALRLLSQEHVEVLTDVVMPGLNGIELAKQAKQLLPDLKVLFMTGYYSRTRRLGSWASSCSTLSESRR